MISTRLTGICDGQSDGTGVHVGILERKDASEDGDERADEVGEIVEHTVGLPEIPEAASAVKTTTRSDKRRSDLRVLVKLIEHLAQETSRVTVRPDG